MRFMNLLISLVGLSASVAAFTVNSPSASTYWVQFSTNTISWSTGGNDPGQVSLQIINANSTLLNGVFSIAEYIPAALQSYTVTNVTLIVADGYMVQMVNPANASQVYATSGSFSVKPDGTAPAPGSTPGSTNSMSGNMSGSMSGNMTGMKIANVNSSHNTASGFGNSTNNTAGKNGASSAASSAGPLSSAALLGVASAIGLAIV